MAADQQIAEQLLQDKRPLAFQKAIGKEQNVAEIAGTLRDFNPQHWQTAGDTLKEILRRGDQLALIEELERRAMRYARAAAYFQQRLGVTGDNGIKLE